MTTSPVGEAIDAITVITGTRYATGPHTVVQGSPQVAGGRLQGFQAGSETQRASGSEINLEGFLLLPGLINAHDHLQYSLHPKLGNPPYNNYVEWGDDIHATLPSVISHYKAVPRDARLGWGGIRNLLCGVTTVCHHDSFWPALQAEGYPVKVLRNYGWAHSVRLAADIREAWAATPDGSAFFVHACEGTDELARGELDELDRLGMLDAKTVIVHGLALNEAEIALVQERRASLVLCPSSNQFLYNRLPDMKHLSAISNIALGNDSPLTAAGDLLDEVRFAIEHTSIPAETAYRMVTDRPAAILRLANGEGHIAESGCADFIAVRDNSDLPCERLRTLSWRDIEFVMIAGQVQLASEEVWRLLPPVTRRGLEPLCIDGCLRWLRAPVRQLVQQAEEVLGAGMVRLGQRAVQVGDTAIPVARSVASEVMPHEERA
jgi:amidohydrolase family protein